MPRRDLDNDGGGPFEPFDGFEDEEPTPVMVATGTQDNLDEAARIARARAGTIPDDDVAALAHDLKNPLTIIMLETAQIEQRLDPTPAPMQRGLERIAQKPRTSIASCRICSTWRPTRPASSSCASRRSTSPACCAMRSVAPVPTTERHRVRLVIRAICYVEGDEMRIERVVSNLVVQRAQVLRRRDHRPARGARLRTPACR